MQNTNQKYDIEITWDNVEKLISLSSTEFLTITLYCTAQYQS